MTAKGAALGLLSDAMLTVSFYMLKS